MRSENKKRVDFCLTPPPQRAYNHHRPPLSLMYLSASLDANGINSAIIDPKIMEWRQDLLARAEQEIISEIKRMHPRYVGISCYTNEYDRATDVARAVKEFDRNIIVITGGVHPTIMPQDFFYEGSPFDIAVIGEGERTVVELVNAIDEKRSLEDVGGIAFMKDGKFFRTRPPALINDLDGIPTQAYEKVDMAYYLTPNPFAIRGVHLSAIYILITRGCPSNCNFCVNKNLRNAYEEKGAYFRFRTAENVLEEILIAKEKYYPDAFYIIDDAFTLQRSYVEKFCDLLERRNVQLLWSCSTKVSAVDEALLKRMKRAGCIQIDFGVESGSEACLRRMKKGINPQQIKKALKACHKMGIRTFANILLNYPGETEEDVKKTIELLDETKPSVVSLNIFLPYLGTDVYEESGLNLRKEEYYLFGTESYELIKDPRFRFAKHNMDFKILFNTYHNKYNRPWNFIRAHISPAYLAQIAKSRRKAFYLKESVSLAHNYLKHSRKLKLDNRCLCENQYCLF